MATKMNIGQLNVENTEGATILINALGEVASTQEAAKEKNGRYIVHGVFGEVEESKTIKQTASRFNVNRGDLVTVLNRFVEYSSEQYPKFCARIEKYANEISSGKADLEGAIRQ